MWTKDGFSNSPRLLSVLAFIFASFNDAARTANFQRSKQEVWRRTGRLRSTERNKDRLYCGERFDTKSAEAMFFAPLHVIILREKSLDSPRDLVTL